MIFTRPQSYVSNINQAKAKLNKFQKSASPIHVILTTMPTCSVDHYEMARVQIWLKTEIINNTRSFFKSKSLAPIHSKNLSTRSFWNRHCLPQLLRHNLKVFTYPLKVIFPSNCSASWSIQKIQISRLGTIRQIQNIHMHTQFDKRSYSSICKVTRCIVILRYIPNHINLLKSMNRH